MVQIPAMGRGIGRQVEMTHCIEFAQDTEVPNSPLQGHLPHRWHFQYVPL